MMDFNNGSTVNRLYGDIEEGELIAAFRYERDALRFATMHAAEDMNESAWLVVSNLYSGKVTVVRKPALTEQNLAA